MKNTLITPKDVANSAAHVSDVSSSELRSSTRRASVVCMRDICCKIMKEDLFMIQDEIAKYFSRDRSAICHGLKRADINIDEHNRYKKIYELMLFRLNIPQK